MTSEQDPAQPPDSAKRDGFPGAVKVGAVFVVLVGAAAWLLAGSDNPFVYSKLVHEVMSEPDSFEGRRLRVEGELRQGSIQFRESPCEWRFVIFEEDKEMPVRFPQCVVPDTFRDGMGIQVTVQGELGGDGVFLANQVIPRCPSKYEMQQRMEAGEEMPYDPNAKLPGPGET
ncbi:MAG: cytochrome c maturation protein CcmE [Deltaproteobacteria bacterium]|nr:cytochrome c maturation protein CcmE [Deltaproteobacteria bacterium]